VALPDATRRKAPVGHQRPRIAPPLPARSRIKEFVEASERLNLTLMPWQKLTGRYLMALGPDDTPLYREVALVAPRRNGKTTLLLPRIYLALMAGQQVIHTAQDRALPGETFETLADLVDGRPEVRTIRRANGQETIKFRNGGRYTLVAPNHGVRGRHADLAIVDEVREQHDERLVMALLPTIATSPHAQVIYLSNAGDDESVVLNDLRKRRDESKTLAYLEWSASPERSIDDMAAWAEANPALGHTLTVERLAELRASLSPAAFETEHLCRWVSSMRERLVPDGDWRACEDPDLPEAVRPALAVSLDPEGRRASAAIAWQLSEPPYIGVRVLYEASGDPINVPAFAKALKDQAAKARATKIAYDPITDRELAKYLPNAKAVGGRDFANGSQLFAQLTKARHLRWSDADALTDDLLFTARKVDNGTGSYQAVRAADDRPITAALAAIRAVWLASGPQLVGRPMIG
jgi:hypothetical protein